jgi:N-acetylglucosamine-6-phosphate deacetylase
MKILVETKGPGGVILITDAVRVAGLPEGDYTLDTRTVTVRDGAVRLPDGALAGSTLTMDRALRNLLAAIGRPLADLWPTTSRNAARAIGLESAKGNLAAGLDADLVLLTNEQHVCLTVVGGEVVYEASPPAA